MVLKLEIGLMSRILLVGDFYFKGLEQQSLEMRQSIFSVAPKCVPRTQKCIDSQPGNESLLTGLEVITN